jgi:hypothetical protein
MPGNTGRIEVKSIYQHPQGMQTHVSIFIIILPRCSRVNLAGVLKWIKNQVIVRVQYLKLSWNFSKKNLIKNEHWCAS